MKGKKLLAALTALFMLAAGGCGYVEDIEPEEDGANIIAAPNDDEDTPDDENANENDNDNTDPETDGEQSDSEEQTDTSSEEDQAPEEPVTDTDSSEEDVQTEDSSAADTDDGAPRELASGRGDSYYNQEFGINVPLPQDTAWQEYDDGLNPWFEDASAMFRVLMETENENDWVLSMMYYQSDKTLDDFTKDAWDRDYRNAGESEDKYEVVDTQRYDTAGHDTQLITEKLESSNGVFWHGYVYVTLGQGEYIWFRISCQDEAILSQLCECVKNVSFELTGGQ